MKTLKKYISVIAVSTAGFTVDVLKKYVGGIAIISACFAWLHMISAILDTYDCPKCWMPDSEKMWVIFSIIAVVSGGYASICGKTQLTRLGGYSAIFPMFIMLCFVLWRVFYMLSK